jgi:hypothetical protein
MTQPNINVLEGRASNQAQRIIGQKFFLISDISFICQKSYIKLYLNQSAIQFETLEVMRILNIRHVISK